MNLSKPKNRTLALAAFLAALILCSCTAPEYNLMRVAAVPAPYVPSRAGYPLSRGTALVQFEANPLLAIHPYWDLDYYSDIGDAGLLISTTQLGGAAYISTGNHFEMGVQYRYAPLDWMVANATDVPDFPAGGCNGVPIYGCGMRLNGPLLEDGTAHISGIIELNMTPIPEATYVLDSETGQWRYRGTETETWLFPAAFLQFDQTFMEEAFDIYMFMGIERSVTNTGFDYDTTGTNEYSVEGTAVCSAGGGFDFIAEGVFFGVGAMLSNSPHYEMGDLSVSFYARLGFIIKSD